MKALRIRNLAVSTRLLAALVAALTLAAPGRAAALCGCPSGGVPLIDAAAMKGNDLNEVRGGCAPGGARVELQVSQRHLARAKLCPPRCEGGDIWSYCINQCDWTTVATTVADAKGNYRFANLDSTQSVQLVATLPGRPDGLDGVYTVIRLRTQDPATGQWSAWVDEPVLEGFNLAWDEYREGKPAYIETRVSRAHQLQVTVADGPDDGDDPTVTLDVDEDTPNYWLSRPENYEGTVEYTRWGVCDVWQGCPASWHILQSPSIVVQSPLLGRNSEFPYVLGMVTAARPGAMFIATSILGPRSIADVTVQVDVDIDVDLGLDFHVVF